MNGPLLLFLLYCTQTNNQSFSVMKLRYLVICVSLLSAFSALAQDASKREIGLRTSPADLTNVGFIYKKQIAENTYRRYRLAVGNLGVGTTGNEDVQVNFGVSTAIGREKRRPLDDRLKFIYGPEFVGSLNIVATGAGTTTINTGNGTITVDGSGVLIAPSVGLGYVLGAQYDINPKWYISAEIIPTVSLYGIFGEDASVFGLQAGFNSSSVGITGAYKF